MPKPIRRRRCRHCNELFKPDVRNTTRQKFCSKPECRKASKAASQKRWLEKKENRDYFRGRHHVARVREWRRNNPGYRRRRVPKTVEPLQDLSSEKTEAQQALAPVLPCFALQDLFEQQPAVLIGLIAQLSGSVLQDHIVVTVRRLKQLGNDILCYSNQGAGHD